MQRGADHQNRVAARFLVHLLTEEPFTFPGEPVGGRVLWVRCETGESVDDIHVKIERRSGEAGFLWVQCKTAVNADISETSPFAEALAQFAGQQAPVSLPGNAPQEWDRTLEPERDALVLAVESGSAIIITHLPAVLARLRNSAALTVSGAARNKDEQRALDVTLTHMRRLNPALDDEGLRRSLMLFRLLRWDLSDGGDEHAATLRLLQDRALSPGADPSSAWHELVGIAGALARERSEVDRAGLLRLVRFPTQAPQRFIAPIQALRQWSAGTHDRLRPHGELPGMAGMPPVQIARGLASDLFRVVSEGGSSLGHLAVVGDAGAGKTGILVDLVARLLEAGHDVVFLAVEDLEDPRVNVTDIPDVLSNWTGARSGYLIVDALDAARTEVSFGVAKRLLFEVNRRCPRWRMVASIRTWDLRYGSTWREIFRVRRGGSQPTALPGVCSIEAGSLTVGEIEQLRSRFPALYDLATGAEANERRWMWTPFHLRLAADLLLDGVPALELTTIRDAPDLVARWWAERVRGGSPVECSRAVATLREAVLAMLAAPTLRLPASDLHVGDATSLDRLRSHGVLDRDRVVLAFAHHALFDYAVADLVLATTDAAEFVQTITTRPQFALLARPSIRFHFHRLWGEEPVTFWAHVFALENSGVSEVAKVLGPAEAARRFRRVEDLEPSLAALTDASTAACASAVLGHILGGLDETERPPLSADPRPWAALARRLADLPGDHALFLAGHILTRLVPDEKTILAPDHAAVLGEAARIHLERVLDRGSASLRLLRRAVDAVCILFPSDPTASAAVLRRVLADTWVEHGHELIYVLTRHIERIIQANTQFAAAVFLAALGHSEQRDSPVPMGGSQIMPFSTSPANTYAGGVHTLQEAYPKLLRADIHAATPVVIAALYAFFRRNNRELDSADRFAFRGREATLQTDYSAIWFKGRGHHDEQRMLEAWESEVVRRHECGEPVLKIVDQVLETTGLASLWRAFLRLGIRDPVAIGTHLREATWTLPLLLGYDTGVVCGEFVRALHPALRPEEKAKVEEAILSIPTSHPGNPEFASHAVARLLGCIPFPATAAATEAKSALGGENLDLEPEADSEPVWIESSPAILARIRGIDPDRVENSELLALAIQLRTFAEPFLNDAAPLPAVESVLPLLERAASIIPKHIGSAEAVVVAEAQGYLAQAAQRCAECRDLRSSPVALATTRDLLLASVVWPGLPRVPQDDEQYSGSYGMPNAPISAAQGLCRLAAKADSATPAVLAAVEVLSQHATAAVRGQVLHRVWWLHETDPARMWKILDERVGKDASPGVVHDGLQSLSILGRKWPHEVARMALRVAEVPGVPSRRGKDSRAEAIALLVHLHVAKAQTLPIAMLSGVTTAAGARWEEAGAMVRPLADYLVHGDPASVDPAAEAIRKRAWALMEPLCVSAAAAWASLAAESIPDASPDAVRGVASLIDQLVVQLHQAVKEDEHGQSGQVVGTSLLVRFLSEARISLEALSHTNHPRMVHHFIELLADLAPANPTACLLLMRNAVAGSGGGYAGERLGMEGITNFLRWLMAEHRDTVTADAEGRAAVLQIVEPFLRVGWPEARRLADEIDRWFR